MAKQSQNYILNATHLNILNATQLQITIDNPDRRIRTMVLSIRSELRIMHISSRNAAQINSDNYGIYGINLIEINTIWNQMTDWYQSTKHKWFVWLMIKRLRRWAWVVFSFPTTSLFQYDYDKDAELFRRAACDHHGRTFERWSGIWFLMELFVPFFSCNLKDIFVVWIDCSHFHFLCFESARLPRGRVPPRRSGVPDKDQPDSIPVPKSDFIRRALARRSQVRISSSDLLCWDPLPENLKWNGGSFRELLTPSAGWIWFSWLGASKSWT